MRVVPWLDRASDGGLVPWYNPVHDPIRRLALRHRPAYATIEVTVWIAAIMLDTLDMVTTAIGVAHPNLVEAVPLSHYMLVTFGWPGLLAEHLFALLALAGLWYAMPKPYRLIVPMIGIWIGYLITVGNVVRLLEHGIL